VRAEMGRIVGQLTAAVFLCSLVACGPSAPAKITLLTHDSFAVSDDVLKAFEERQRISVEVLRAGDAGAMVNQAILTRDAPVADAIFGVDNTFLSRALDAGILLPYRSPALAGIPEELRLDPQNRVTPIDYGDVCINWDRDAFDAELPPPQTLEDLAEPAYRGMLVVENPATSSPGLAFLLATIVRFGEEGSYTWRDYWRELRDNDVLVSAGWEDAYYGSFSGGAGQGDRPLVVSYATSPAVEVYFADPPPNEASTGVLVDGCFRQVEFVGILAGTKAEASARALIDFLLSADFQQDVPLQMFVYPADPSASLPAVFVEHAQPIADPITLDPATIGAGRERWIEEWTDVVLH
jgi:thiamine transport system substrate-binding protein